MLALLVSPFLGRGLNGLALGEASASHLGIPVQRFKRIAIVVVAAATGASVAVSGGIGFVGVVVPHLLRLVIGPDHRYLLPASALLGASLLLLRRRSQPHHRRAVGTANRHRHGSHWRAVLLVDIAATPRHCGSLTMISVSNVSVALGRKTIINDASFDAGAGKLTVIVGPNGSGKTTLMRALSGELPFTGRITINDHSLRRLKPWQMAAMRAILPQSTSLSFPFTVHEIVRLGLTSGRSGATRYIVPGTFRTKRWHSSTLLASAVVSTRSFPEANSSAYNSHASSVRSGNRFWMASRAFSFSTSLFPVSICRRPLIIMQIARAFATRGSRGYRDPA